MSWLKNLFGGGDASDNNDDIRKADESFDEFVERVRDRKRVKPEDVTPENIERLNAQAAIDVGLTTPTEYVQKRRERLIEKYNEDIERINSKYARSDEPVNEPEPVSDWYLGNDGYMVRMYSDGVERR